MNLQKKGLVNMKLARFFMGIATVSGLLVILLMEILAGYGIWVSTENVPGIALYVLSMICIDSGITAAILFVYE